MDVIIDNGNFLQGHNDGSHRGDVDDDDDDDSLLLTLSIGRYWGVLVPGK